MQSLWLLCQFFGPGNLIGDCPSVALGSSANCLLLDETSFSLSLLLYWWGSCGPKRRWLVQIENPGLLFLLCLCQKSKSDSRAAGGSGPGVRGYPRRQSTHAGFPRDSSASCAWVSFSMAASLGGGVATSGSWGVPHCLLAWDHTCLPTPFSLATSSFSCLCHVQRPSRSHGAGGRVDVSHGFVL